MIDLLLRSDPSKARTDSERAQADQVYKVGTTLRVCSALRSLLSTICSLLAAAYARPVTPEPNLEPANDNFARPCPTCHPGNAYGCGVQFPSQTPPSIRKMHSISMTASRPAMLSAATVINYTPSGSNVDKVRLLPGLILWCGYTRSLLRHWPAFPTAPWHGRPSDLILSGTIYDCFQRNPVEVSKTQRSSGWYSVTGEPGRHTCRLSQDERVSLRAVYKEVS